MVPGADWRWWVVDGMDGQDRMEDRMENANNGHAHAHAIRPTLYCGAVTAACCREGKWAGLEDDGLAIRDAASHC